MKRKTKKAAVAMAACPYCEKKLKQPGWAPHIRRMHPDRPFLPFGSALAEENPKMQARVTAATAACPYCRKDLKQRGWAPHIHRMHPEALPTFRVRSRPRKSSGGGDRAGSARGHRARRQSARPGCSRNRWSTRRGYRSVNRQDSRTHRPLGREYRQREGYAGGA